MKNPRHIVIKSLFNATEYTNFSEACNDADVSQSKQLRDLAADWVAKRNDRRRSGRGEWPISGQGRSMFCPGRARIASRMSFRS